MFFSHQNSGTFLHRNLLYLHCISSVLKPYYFKICRLFYWVVTKLLNYLALDFMLMISFHASLKKQIIILDLFLNEKIIGSKMITLGLTSLLFVSTFSLVFWSSMIDNTFFFVTEFWRTEVHVSKHTHSKRTGISLHDHKCLKTCLPSSLALPTAYCVLRQEHLFDLKSKVKNHTCTCTYPKQIIPCFVTKSESITLDLQKVYLPTRIIKMSKCVQFRSCKLLLHIYFYQMTSIWEYTEQLVWFFSKISQYKKVIQLT